VVMGGKSARSRDVYMEALIEKYIDEGGAARARYAEQAEPQAEAPHVEPERKAQAIVPPQPVAAPDPGRLSIAAVAPDPRPRPAYVSAAPQPARDADESRLPTASIARPAARTGDGSTAAQAQDTASAVTPAGRWMTGPTGREALRTAVRFQASDAAGARSDGKLDNRVEITPPARPEAQDLARPAAKQAAKESVKLAKAEESAGAKPALPTKPPAPGWMIQIGATDDAGKAADLLNKAKAKRGALLASAKPYTEIVHKSGGAIYRARFAGLEESRAEAACKALKSSGFSCFTTKN
jgi:D-alanyl-D-alanine carboxypeptidase